MLSLFFCFLGGSESRDNFSDGSTQRAADRDGLGCTRSDARELVFAAVVASLGAIHGAKTSSFEMNRAHAGDGIVKERTVNAIMAREPTFQAGARQSDPCGSE